MSTTHVPPNATIPSYTGANYARWVCGRMLFSNGAAAGIHRVAILVPAYSILLNVGVIGVALWNQGTSATLIVGDADDDNGFIVATDLKATELLAGESIWVGAGTAMAGGQIGAYVANSQWTIGSGVAPQYNAAARVVTFKNTTVGGAATTGETLCFVNYVTFSGSEPIVTGTYVAS
jgi:hypothetical protein